MTSILTLFFFPEFSVVLKAPLVHHGREKEKSLQTFKNNMLLLSIKYLAQLPTFVVITLFICSGIPSCKRNFPDEE
jgi:hypothetical protein